MDESIFLKTNRLTLRNLQPDDWHALSTKCGVPEVADTLLSMDAPWGEAAVKAWIEKFKWRGAATYRLAICLNGELIGAVGFAGTEGKFGFGYFLAPTHWGQGYATEASIAFLRDAIARFDIPHFKSAAYVRNAASHKILLKLGFEETGRGHSPKIASQDPKPEIRYELNPARFTHAYAKNCAEGFEIETKRLFLRALKDDDWEDLQQLAGVEDVARMLGSITAPWPKDAVLTWISRTRGDLKQGFRLGVCLKDGTLIGMVGLGGHPVSCGYFLGKDYWRNGYMSEAFSAFVTACFARFPQLNTIDADHFIDNPMSGQLLSKLGFKRTGESTASSLARLEPAPILLYRLKKPQFKAANP